FDRAGRTLTASKSTNTTTFIYNAPGLAASESFTAGFLSGYGVTNEFDSLFRRKRTGLHLNGAYAVNIVTNSYDAASRLQNVGNDLGSTATYTYANNSPLVSQILFKNGAATRLTTTKSYDFIDRLTQVSHLPSADSALSFNY